MPRRSRAPTVAAVFAQRLREMRDTRGWTQQDLADRMRELGYPMDRASIVKIERLAPESRGRGAKARKVSIDEVFAFAAALGVLPGALLHPPDDVAIAPGLELDSVLFDAWTSGWLPLRRDEIDVYSNSRRSASPSISFRELPGIAAERLEQGDLLPEVREALLAYVEHEQRELKRLEMMVAERGGPWPSSVPETQAGESEAERERYLDLVIKRRREEVELLLELMAQQVEPTTEKRRRKK